MESLLKLFARADPLPRSHLTPSEARAEFAGFDFGSNWEGFVRRHLTPEAMQGARASLSGLFGAGELAGKSVLDIGCGSGLFSYAAHELGAARLVSFDVDLRSVACCRLLHERAGSPASWRILEGSVLDDGFMGELGTFDLVYSWGVLHHTGEIWRAIGNAAGAVAPGGLFAVAIYNRVDGRLRGSPFWEREKRLYARSGRAIRRSLELGYAAFRAVHALARLRSPRAVLISGRRRGMNFWVDLRDWVGGYPYEYASAGQVFEYCHGRLGLTLERLLTTNGLGNNEFVFRRPEAADPIPG